MEFEVGPVERQPSRNTTASTIPFPVYGVTLGFFREFIDNVCGGEANVAHMTTTNVCETFIKPQTAAEQRSYCELLVRQEHPDVGVADVFISHAWSCRFLDVYDALTHHFRHESPHLCLWFDLFSNNQHATLDRDFDWWCGTFKGAIGAMQHVVMVLAPWHDPVPLTRAWCLFELYCSAETRCRFEIAMSRHERAQFVASMVRDVEGCLLSVLHRVRCERSQAFDPNDQRRIFEAVERTVGFAQINAMVFEQLRRWFVHALEETLLAETALPPASSSPAHAASQVATPRSTTLYETLLVSPALQRNVSASSASSASASASMLSPLSLPKLALSPQVSTSTLLATLDAGDAASVFSAAPSPLRPDAGADGGENGSECDDVADFGDDEAYWQRLAALAQVFVLQGASLQAHAVLQPLYLRLQRRLGRDHVQTLAVGRDLAMVQQKHGRYSEAQLQYLRDYDQRRRLHGADHPDTLVAMNFVANTANHLGQFAEAETLHRSCLATRRRVLGADHADTRWSQNNLALALRDRATQENVRLFRVALRQAGDLGAPGRAADGAADEDEDDASLARRRRWLEEAIELLRDCHRGRLAQLGADHTLTLGALHNLANNLRDLAALLLTRPSLAPPEEPQRLRDEAAALYDHCVAQWTMMLGVAHSLPLLARLNRAVSQTAASLDAAIDALRGVARDLSAGLGDTHPFTLQAVQQLVGALLARHLRHRRRSPTARDDSDADEARERLAFCLQSRTEVLGADHPATLLVAQLAEDWAAFDARGAPSSSAVDDEALAAALERLGV